MSHLSDARRNLLTELNLQCTEVTGMMLGDGLHRKMVASTLCEIRGALDLVNEGKLDEVG